MQTNCSGFGARLLTAIAAGLCLRESRKQDANPGIFCATINGIPLRIAEPLLE
jgi:hypothetical protein